MKHNSGKTSPSVLLRLRWFLVLASAAAAALVPQPAQAQAASTHYPPGYFDVNITLGCDCTCWCDTNNTPINPVAAFLAANPVESVSAIATLPPMGQLVPPHWTVFPPADVKDPANAPFALEGWTLTKSTDPNLNWGALAYPPFSLTAPINFTFPFPYYQDGLSWFPGSDPDLHQSQTDLQPYPWDVNVTLTLANNHQTYVMEQQLAVGYWPKENDFLPPQQAFLSPVDYSETNALLTITLQCTETGQPVQVAGATITATLDDVNIPLPLAPNAGGMISFGLTNWCWPLTFTDQAWPPSPTYPPTPPNNPYNGGWAGTVQASLSVGATANTPIPFQNVGLLVRANRSYTLTITYSVVCKDYLGIPYAQPVAVPATYDTGVVGPCTNTTIIVPATICSCTGPGQIPCFGAIKGQVNMLGLMAPGTDIYISASGANGSYPPPALAPALASQPAIFTMYGGAPYKVVGSKAYTPADAPYSMQATMGLSLNTDYEYFQSPIYSPVEVPCNDTVDTTTAFVMCPGNPGIVQGIISLNGAVDPHYYSGVGALQYLQFAPPIPPVPTDLTLQSFSYIMAAGEMPLPVPPFPSPGGGIARTAFDNPGSFTSLNSYVGNYSLRLAGLGGQATYWDANDLHLVFGPQVAVPPSTTLSYDIIEAGGQYNISCGTNFTRNITNCFGLVTVAVINDNPGDQCYTSGSLQVWGVGPGGAYTVPKFPVPFVFPPCTSTKNEADIQLFLPAGDYTYQATVNILLSGGGSGTGTLDPTNFSVTCCTNCCVQPPPGMVDWWPFDEAPGGQTANDIAGQVNNAGAYNGNPMVIQGMVGNALCLNLNGTSDFLVVADDPEVNFVGSCSNKAESFTIDAWIRATTNELSIQTLLDKRVNTSFPIGYSLYLYNGQLGLQIADGTVPYNNIPPYYTSLASGLGDGQWHFIAVTVARCVGTNNVLTFYVDGSSVKTFSDPLTGDLNNNAYLQIGRREPAFATTLFGIDFAYYLGCIDELEIFKRVLGADEIQGIFKAGSAGKCKSASGISGQKFYDLNGNGVRDPGEPGLSGWTMQANGPTGPFTAATDVNGYYHFLNLGAGTYTVTEVPQSGWTQTAPAGGLPYTVTLAQSQQVNGQDFGNWHTNNTNCVQIFCPTNIVAPCSGSGAVVAFTASATSLCTTNPVQVICLPPSGSLFPVGTTVVHCTAVDSLANWAACSFTVTVQPCITNAVLHGSISNKVFILNGDFSTNWGVQSSTDLFHWAPLLDLTSPPPFFINMSNVPAQFFRLLYQTNN